MRNSFSEFFNKNKESEIKYSIKDHMFHINGNPVRFIESPNCRGIVDPKFLVIHFTASGGDKESVAKWFANPSAKVSAHLIVDYDGSCIQSVRFDKIAYHAGASSWRGFKGLNRYSIGIEVVNPGPLTRLGNGKYKAWFGKIYSSDKYPIIEARHENGGDIFGWIPFTEAQTRFLIEAGRVIMDHYNLMEAVGHDMISPGRKVDPGPCMDKRVYDRLNASNNTDDNEANETVIVKAKRLNFRTGPGTEFPVISVLERGEVLKRLDSVGQWIFVETKDGIRGFVHGNYVQ